MKQNINSYAPRWRSLGSAALLFLVTGTLAAQTPNHPAVRPVTSPTGGGVVFEENKKQWPAQVMFMADAGAGVRLFMEKGRFTYVRFNEQQLEAFHDAKHVEEGKTLKHSPYDEKINMHAFRINFTGSNPFVQPDGMDKLTWYRNYYKGNDRSKWSPAVNMYNRVVYNEFYPGISLEAYDSKGQFKYDFVVKAGADASVIRMDFEGVEGLTVTNGQLTIPTSAGALVEDRPYSYQLINGYKVEVPCEYNVDKTGRTVSFVFPKGYNKQYALVIDPTLVGASYSGSPSSTTTYGHCATYDNGGNIYTGGECFGTGYPTTVGAFQSTFGGSIDIAVEKLTPNAGSLLYCSYIGGNSSDYPNSLITNNAGELYVLGSTASSNYPTSVGCFDNSYNGGNADICVSGFNATGTAVVGSTYVGGSTEDGGGGWTSFMNGHDGMRGEIILDPSGNPIVTSFTNSTNFPTAGAFDATHNGMFDACVFRLSANCANLQWSTYLGGSGNDMGYGVRYNAAGEVFVCGPTTSTDFPITVGTYQTTYQGGNCDGYMAHFNAAGNGLVAASYFGTPQSDVNYFMDIDVAGNPYFYGTTAGSTPITLGVYANPGSGNFVTKFNPGLTAPIFATQFGDGGGGHLEPEAFMIDTCENIYVSGFQSTGGYPITTNGLYTTQAACGGGSCYFIVLKQNVTALLYGSFYYGWHVDGGTSRFDPNGTIYQGICIGGGGATTPTWAFDNGTSPSSWDMFVVKIAFQLAGTIALASAAPNDTICPNTTVNFTNNSVGLDFLWDFGDGSPTDTTTSPSHPYSTPGTYTVTLIAVDSTSCIVRDTTQLTIVVLPAPSVNLGPDTVLCNLPNYVLNAQNPGMQYTWSTGATSQSITVTTPGTYIVDVSNGICSDQDTVVVSITTPPSGFSDTALCAGTPLTLDADNPGSQFLWNTGAITQTINVTTTGIYAVAITNGSCVIHDTMDVNFIPYPVVNLQPNTTICPGNQLQLDAGNPGLTYLWSTGATTQQITVNAVGVYSVTVTDSMCSASDSTTVGIIAPLGFADSISICNATNLELNAGVPNATSYTWSTGETTQSIAVSESGAYSVIVDMNGCLLYDTTFVDGELGGGVVWVPNTFTPNGNALNETFCPVGNDITEIHLQIFNRWGQLLYETKSLGACWDGKYMGNVVQEDVYVYRLSYRTRCGGEKLERKIGHVAVLR